MNETCETLANTGTSQLLLLAGAVFLVLTAILLLRKRGIQVRFLPVLILMLVGFYSFTPVMVHAQSSEACMTQANEDEDETPAVVTSLSLQNDSGEMLLPDGGNPTVVYYMSLLNNDTPPTDDTFDWNTLDIDTGQDGVQQSRNIQHPDDSDYDCGDIDVMLNGILRVTLEYTCYDILANALTIDNDFVITPFGYLVTSENDVTTETPATVNITVSSSADTVVTALGDTLECEASQTVDILANDSTSSGTLDPDTVDLDPNTPGIQQTYSYVGFLIVTPYTFTATVDNDGNILVTTEAPTAGMQFFYTVSNTNGDISPITLINGDSCA